MGLGKGRKVPQSVKIQRKIDTAVDVALKQQSHAYIHSKELDQAQIEQLKKQLTDALKQPIQITPDYAAGILEETKHTGLIVQNWHTAWKWVSTWAFGLIAYVSVAGIPQEVIALVPEASQSKVTAALALLGFLGRFINQSRGK
ncbi:MAG: hypothetical protein RSA22_03925 [Acinetobacter sp.]